MRFLSKFRANRKAISMMGAVMGIVGLVVAVYVASAILPDAIVDLTNTTLWTGAPAAVITLGTTVGGIVAVVAFILLLLRSVRS